MFALAIHGGAGERLPQAAGAAQAAALRAGLQRALLAAGAILERGGPALEAVEQAVVLLEDDPLFNAGCGAALTRDGTAQLDAAIMDGARRRAGAVAGVERVKNPVRLARGVLERSAHVFMIGAGAERLAAELGLALVDPSYFITEPRRAQLAAHLAAGALGTVGAVACDRAGDLAAATSTGGTVGKRPGRVGDSPVIGAGTYADNETCAVSATGHGEWLLRSVQAYDVAARMRYGGASLEQAACAAIHDRPAGCGGAAGLIAVDRSGRLCVQYNTPAMLHATLRAGEAPAIHVQ